MKKRILLTIALTALVLLTLGAFSAQAGTYGDLTYSIWGGKVEITDCNTSATEVVIPETIEGYTVNSIGYSAFEDCTSLTCITIPDSVTSIGDFAFFGCTSLASITIPDSVTSIGSRAFEYCTGLERVYITDIAAWCSITFGNSDSNPLYNGADLYLNNEIVNNLIIPSNVTSISEGAFCGCNSLASIELPDTITAIDKGVFYNCNNLASITIPDSITSIDVSAFYNCTSLESIAIPDSVTSIGRSAFSNCDSLTNITIPDSLASIDSSVFSNCDSLESIAIPDSVTSIGSYAFSDCYSLASIIIPDSVTSIGNGAFSDCYSLASIIIPDSVTSIGNDAFEYCTGLERVYITDITAWCNITFDSYDSNPLYNGADLYLNDEIVTKLVIPVSVTKINYTVFRRCTSIASITIPDSVTSIGNYAFSDCTSLTSITIGNSVTTIGESAFSNCDSLANITIPDSVTSIGDYAFKNCNSLANITIPDSVTSIGESAFSNCDSLANITIPDSMTSIGEYAFSYCDKLTSATIGSGITTILIKTFYNCKNLKYVCLPQELMYILNDAFNDCTSIQTVFYEGSEAQWDAVLKYNRNENLTNAKVIYNATQKTYSFETNCDITLPDMTSYAVFESPVIKDNEKALIGWYTDESLSGEPVTFPYCGTETTLYAEWTDKTGLTFDDAFIAKENAQYTVTTTESEQIVYYEFVPRFTGEYRFYTTGSLNTYGYLYNSNRSQLTYDNNGGNGNNFHIARTLTAGETYYIGAKVYNGSGTFTLVTETDCVEGTTTVYITSVSGEKIFSTTPSYLPENAQVILTCYKDGRMVNIQNTPNKNETIYFTVSDAFDTAKVMVWESFESLKPLCTHEKFVEEAENDFEFE